MSHHAAWWVTLGLGLVVAIVAVVLLETFYRKVRQIEGGSEAIWEAGKQVARNTATTWMLGQTSQRLDMLTAEALRHDAFLTAVGAPASSAPLPAPSLATSPSGPAPVGEG